MMHACMYTNTGDIEVIYIYIYIYIYTHTHTHIYIQVYVQYLNPVKIGSNSARSDLSCWMASSCAMCVQDA